MQVRDARERDAPAMADLTDAPEEVLRNVVHERSVRVLIEDANGGDGDADGGDGDADGGDGDVDGRDGDAESEDEGTALRGFVSFDAREGAVDVTQFGGDSEACERLLAEPISFARREGLLVELLLRDGDDAMRAAVDAAGFDRAGDGPRFGGEATQRYRFDPT